MLTKTQKEELRHAVREFLACRPMCAFTAWQAAKMMARRSTLDFALEEADIAEAFVFLENLTQATKLTDDLGSTVAYQITAQGVLAFERGA